MRCDCLECKNNESYYCGCPDGSVGVDENGQCNWLLLPLSEEEHVIESTTYEWISVKDKLPEPEIEVLVLTNRRGLKIITNGMYENGTIHTNDSMWYWHEADFEYDEEADDYIIAEGWWEYKHYNHDDEYNNLIDDVVTHWMPLPKPMGKE